MMMMMMMMMMMLMMMMMMMMMMIGLFIAYSLVHETIVNQDADMSAQIHHQILVFLHTADPENNPKSKCVGFRIQNPMSK